MFDTGKIGRVFPHRWFPGETKGAKSYYHRREFRRAALAGPPVVGERLLAETLPAEFKNWNIPVILASGFVVVLSATQVSRVLRDKQRKDETEQSDLLIATWKLILPDSHFGWI